VLETADEHCRRPRWFAGELNVLDSGQELLEKDTQLQAGEVGAQAEVNAVSEGHVLVIRPSDVEPEWVVECGLVPIGRQVGEIHGVTGRDCLTSDDLRSSVAVRMNSFTGVTHRIISSTAVAPSDGSSRQAGELVGMAEQCLEASGDRRARRVVPAVAMIT
jgi:hypothetical protein